MIRIDSEKERKKGGHLLSATLGRQGVDALDVNPEREEVGVPEGA